VLTIAEHWQGSDLGRQRQGNEDNYFVRAPLFVVADGMGGAQAGEVASEMAVQSFEDGLPTGSPAEALVTLIEGANRRIHERSRSDAEHAGMGTTITAAHVGEGEVTIAHVGDSRAYVFRDGDLMRLTRDHSLVGELVARGKLTEEQAESHPQRSVITRALGPEAHVQVDVDTYPARAGDVFLLCSDGLTGMVPEARVKPFLDRADTLEQAGRELIAAANEAGGRDNITVVLFRIDEVEAADGAAASATASGSEEETSEYDTWEGEALAPRQGIARPSAQARTRVRDDDTLHADEVRAAVQASTEQEAAYRRDGTVALSAVQPRAAPVEGVPAGTATADRPVPPPPPDAERPRRRRRRRVPTPLVVGLALLAIVAAGFWGATRVVFFIGTDPDAGNAVAIYQGLPYELPFGLNLYSRRAVSGVTLDQVAPARRATFTDHKLRSLDDAENLVNALEEGRLEP
jgi:serine/threonine protein phosphatase PrpC